MLSRRTLLLHRGADRSCRRGPRGLVLLDFLAFLLADGCAVAETDPAGVGAGLDDLEVVIFVLVPWPPALPQPGGGAEARRRLLAPAAILDFRVMAEPFDVLSEFHERAERGDARNLATHDVA